MPEPKPSLPVELEQEFVIGNFKEMSLYVTPVLDSDVHKLSSESIFPLMHLRVLEVGRKKLTIEDLRCKNIALKDLQKYLESEEIQKMVTRHYLPSLTKDSWSWNVTLHLRCAPGYLHIDIVVGHVDVVRKIKHVSLLT